MSGENHQPRRPKDIGRRHRLAAPVVTALMQTRGKRTKKALDSLDHLLAKIRIDLGYDRKGGYPGAEVVNLKDKTSQGG